MPNRDGIDVAEYQHYIDHAAVVAAGVTWWMHKATRGHDKVDPFHMRNKYGADLVPFRARGMYHWLEPGDVAVQAAWFIGHTDTYQGGWWRPMCDAEQAGITAAGVAEWCDRVEQVFGVSAAVYTGVGVAGGSIWQSSAVFNGQRPRILACWTSEATMRQLCAERGGHLPDVWQFLGDAGRCPGVGAITEGGTMMSLPCDNDMVLDWSKFDMTCGEDHA